MVLRLINTQWDWLKNQVFVELLHDRVLFSELALELRGALYDGLFARTGNDAFLAQRIIREAALPSTDTPEALAALSPHARGKKELVRMIFGIVRSVSEKLAAHRWHDDEVFRQALGTPQSTGVPYHASQEDPIQVSQIKKLVNALYHFEVGLKALEVESNRNLFDYVFDGDPVSTHLTWRGIAVSATASSYQYIKNLSYLSPKNWKDGFYAAIARVTEIPKAINHLYDAFQLLTHIESDPLGAF